MNDAMLAVKSLLQIGNANKDPLKIHVTIINHFFYYKIDKLEGNYDASERSRRVSSWNYNPFLDYFPNCYIIYLR